MLSCVNDGVVSAGSSAVVGLRGCVRSPAPVEGIFSAAIAVGREGACKACIYTFSDELETEIMFADL